MAEHCGLFGMKRRQKKEEHIENISTLNARWIENL